MDTADVLFQPTLHNINSHGEGDNARQYGYKNVLFDKQPKYL